MELIRRAGNAGRFYPASAREIERMLQQWNLIADENALRFPHIQPEAVICPHAGYVYSGFTANVAHRILPRNRPEHILVVGPSHHVYIQGMSLGMVDAYETPFGYLQSDKQMIAALTAKFPFVFSERAHYLEHSTETQFPFIKYYHPGVQIIELIYGDVHYEDLAGVLGYFKSFARTAIVISTDLSHFYNQNQANRLDAYCIEAVKHKDLYMLEKGCEACGKTGVEAIIETALKNNWQSEVLDYRTSGDVTGDYSSVVGYMSAAFYV